MDRFRVISQRKIFKKYKEDNQKKIYVNEVLSTYCARLCKNTHSLQAKKYFKQVWENNGNIKVTTQNGVVKPISTIDDIKSVLPEVYLHGLIWMIIMYTRPNI